MKKLIITILSSLLLLSGCGEKVTWEEIQNVYKDVENQVKNNISIDVVSENDYKELVTKINDYIGQISYSQSDENQDKLTKIYNAAEYLELFASLFDGNAAHTLLSLASNSKGLVKSIYDGNKDEYESLKAKIDEQIIEIENWTKDEWSTVEKKAKLAWKDVESQIESLQEEAKDNLKTFSEVAETDLEELKHTIIDNYQLIKDGVTEDTDAIAKKMYEAALQLKEYTRYINSDSADEVWQFAKDTIAYVEERYGKILSEEEKPELNYEDEANAASKWTQSIWNEITKDLKLFSRQ